MNSNLQCEELKDSGITNVPGFKAAGVYCGVKKNGKDLAIIYSESDTAAAAVFTKNLVKAAPVILCQKYFQNPVRAVVINSGNANACMGEQGLKDAFEMGEFTAGSLDLKPEQVLVCSTGVIGMPLPMDKIRDGVSKAAATLSSSRSAGIDAATAILTTDTVTKEAVYRCQTDRGPFHLAGISKGSGMICPNMATMLAFMVTDVRIDRDYLQELFLDAVDASFNLITVDGDTSTNDTALIMANGFAEGIEITPHSPYLDQFKKALNLLCRDLARKVVEDGEGITKVITLTVRGASELKGARTLAMSVLNSPLVKTAFYGEDANWGRILAALGYAGVDFNPDLVDIYIGSLQVASKGGGLNFSEEKAKAILQKRDIDVLVELNCGSAEATAWGTDMSHEYVTINSDYRS